MNDEAIGVGFRFYPTEEELVSFYLQNKLNGTTPEIERVIPVLDIYAYHPSDLPRLGGEYNPEGGEQWFFFCPRQEREGCRPNRLTKCGYWKATGSPGNVYSSLNRVIGRKKTMVFYLGRAPYGTKTSWKMIHYNAFSSSSPPQLMEDVSLCRIYKRSSTVGAFDRRPPPMAAPDDEAAACHPAVPEIAHCSSADLSQLVESGNSCLEIAHSSSADLSQLVESGNNCPEIAHCSSADLSQLVESGNNRLPTEGDFWLNWSDSFIE